MILMDLIFPNPALNLMPVETLARPAALTPLYLSLCLQGLSLLSTP